MDTEILKKLGLNDNEVNVYLVLLRKGALGASEIAILLKLHRTHVYDLLESLVKKGVISYIVKDGKKFFQGVSPERLDVLLEGKREEMVGWGRDLGGLIKELNEIAQEDKKKLLVSVFQGKQAFMSQLNEVVESLKKGEEYLIMGFTPQADESLQYFLPGLTKRRVKKGIKKRVIVDRDFKGHEFAVQKLQKTRFLPKGESIPMGLIIYREKVIMVIIEDDYFCLKIDNKKISEHFRKYFEFIWKRARD